LDRRFPAIIAIGLIISTIISYFVITDVPDARITVIRNSAPDQIRRQVDLELTHKFSLGIITRTSIQELTIQYLFHTPIETSQGPEGWDDVIPLIQNGKNLLAEFGHRPDLIQGTMAGDEGQTEYLLYDIGRFITLFTEWDLAEDATTSHLIIPRGNENSKQYAGKSGFYHNREELAKVIVSRGEDETTYTAQRSAQKLQAGEKKIGQAPQNGKIVFNDLEEDESISIIIEVMGRADQRKGSLSIILIHVDGVLEKTLLNFID
jgi:hypothetical protein